MFASVLFRETSGETAADSADPAVADHVLVGGQVAAGAVVAGDGIADAVHNVLTAFDDTVHDVFTVVDDVVCQRAVAGGGRRDTAVGTVVGGAVAGAAVIGSAVVGSAVVGAGITLQAAIKTEMTTELFIGGAVLTAESDPQYIQYR